MFRFWYQFEQSTFFLFAHLKSEQWEWVVVKNQVVWGRGHRFNFRLGVVTMAGLYTESKAKTCVQNSELFKSVC